MKLGFRRRFENRINEVRDKKFYASSSWNSRNLIQKIKMNSLNRISEKILKDTISLNIFY